ncbi:phospholipid/cholesterol/gamma-HCH transport system permease protein [Pelomonas saccharophila]|uniref:Phospholipid/cholesterol/gamma-HCH transport system permease protein n=1 Tax=Roseateles saccharophilus TaxID=304 RepID=A0ABU1YQP6_ROSSA|nr:ABC transporter permease [Roseateles saccharophilus]MDR7270531.1 phospholipid/cholesterol/gamma-HCH transport system permease protein [Roseateles saccharophilus]
MSHALSSPLPPSDTAGAGQSRWEGEGQQWRLVLCGDPAAVDLPKPPTQLPVAEGTRLSFDSSALSHWQPPLAGALWQLLAPLARGGVQLDFEGLPRGLQPLLKLSLPQGEVHKKSKADADEDAPEPEWRKTLIFIGDTLAAVGRLARGRSAMRLSDWLWQIEQTGPRSLPIVLLVSSLVGLIVAYMGAEQLQRFGAQSFIANLVTIGVVREIAALVVGIVLAGRVGAAFAAQIGSMRAGEEIDALTTLGVNPVEHLVLPRMLALLVTGPLLTLCAGIAGLAVGCAVAVGLYDVPAMAYLTTTRNALEGWDLFVGLLKGSVYAMLVALAGCRQGLNAGRSAQAVGEATTAAVVQAIVWMVVAASALTVIFQRLGV